MDGIPFDYAGCASGEDFIGRKGDVSKLRDLIRRRKNILLNDIESAGKESLVEEAFSGLKRESPNYCLCTVDLFNVRSSGAFAVKLYNSVAESVHSSGMVPVSDMGEYISDKCVAELLDCCESFCVSKGCSPVILLKEFQNTALFQDAEKFFGLLDSVWSRHEGVTYILCGSGVNLMKYVFEGKKYLYGFAEPLELSKIDSGDFQRYINRTFLKAGKVIEKYQIEKICRVTDCHPGYLRQLCAICYGLTRGYVTDEMVDVSIKMLLRIHGPYFVSAMDGITANQIRFVQAVIDGNDRFSSENVISKYGLRSSANVFRVKEALQKKEVVTFDSGERAWIMDPVFRYWLENYYFANKKI
ncbi:MAG: hypothetical protein LKK19_02655 [Bacteroidales bacterium]|jgi:hypothetical protein|nr:hypothetical protein [Bacteroidales bacterium]MCI2121586.1 hypothetical protein [Bacteroidales bacterium]MCI2145696.1 hypothetical protein [Bacteroidales bacterium]